MKAAITGHTRGLGKELFNVFPESIGFSRENGYDITQEIDRNQILTDSNECDIFINNAHSGFAQQYLLYLFWENWKNKNKIILNIGSRAADLVHQHTYPYYSYAIEKQALESASKYMTHSLKTCKVICIKPGYIDTDSVKDKPGVKMDPVEVANFIKEIVSNHTTFWIPTITLYPG